MTAQQELNRAANAISPQPLSGRQQEVLDLLRERGAEGLSRLDLPAHLLLGLPQRISELRALGFAIETRWRQTPETRAAVYVLVDDNE